MAKTKGTPQLKLHSLVAHALCDMVPGGMSEEEHTALVADLKENGMRIPLVLFEGKILDGRARYRAAQIAEVEIKHEEFTGDEQAARNLVMSANLHRRTLTPMQKALAVAELYKRAVATGGAYPAQDSLAKRYGVSKQTISLCLKAIDSHNAMLLTRMRRGEVSRSELEDEFYDHASAALPTGAGAVAVGADIFGAAPPPVADRGPIFGDAGTPRGPVSGVKTPHPERRTQETPASVAANAFKALSNKDRLAFVALAWPWLEAPVVAHQTTLKASTSSKKPAATRSRGAAALANAE